MQTSSTGVSRTRQVVAAVIGNALEWYDFIVYGFLASIIARQFFPSEDEYASLLMALATFGVGFFMRPVGGILLGMYSDRKGRKAAMQMIIRLMTVSIALIAFAPNYAAIGMGAPLLIVVARMLQRCPGAYLFIGNGVSRPMVHNPAYDFNDDILLTGAAYWGALTESWLKPA